MNFQIHFICRIFGLDNIYCVINLNFFLDHKLDYDSYRFFVIKNESANKIAVSRHIIFKKIELKVTKNDTFKLK